MSIHIQLYKQLFDKSLSEIKRLLTVGDSVALVGNSGILCDSNHGGGIDDHDYIVRFNAAPVEGYEEDVGSKTTHRFLNVLLQRGGTLSHTTGTPKNFITQIRDETVILKWTRGRVQRKARTKIDDSCAVLAIQRSYRQVYPKISKEFFDGRNSGSNLSLGLQGVLIFLPLVNRMDLYGFNAYSSKNISNYHYWEDFTKDDQGPHNYDRERDLLEQLDDINGVEVHE